MEMFANNTLIAGKNIRPCTVRTWVAALAILMLPFSAYSASVHLTWESVPGADLYKVVEDISDDGVDNFVNSYYTQTNSYSIPGKANGTYTYKVIACIERHDNQARLCEEVSEYSGAYTTIIDEQGDTSWMDLTAATVGNVGFIDATAPANEAVGAMPGEAGVSGGQGSYQIPIQMPPGRNGMQPNVSLNYSSSSGNGVVGVGWSLSAYSTISRCSSTWAQDEEVRGVQLDGQDKLCLNGQRLMAIQGNYGEDGTVYRTELDSFALVTQSGSLSGANVSFEVKSPDGSISLYGINIDDTYTDVSVKPTGSNLELSWLLTMVKDVSGKNNIRYTYNNAGNGEMLINTIYYTGNDNNIGDRFVSFLYESRSDVSTRYIAGGKTRQTQRLTTITSGIAATAHWQYSLDNQYSRHSSRSIVKSVQMCNVKSTPEFCYSPTTFEWLDKPAHFELQELSYLDGTDNKTITDNQYQLANVLPRGDTNGDGVRDWDGVYINAEGEKVDDSLAVLGNCPKNYLSFSRSCMNPDFDRDGITDTWSVSNDTMVVKLTKSDGTTQSVSTSVAISSFEVGAELGRYVKNIADYNGDGWPDLMVYDSNEYNSNHNNRPHIRYYEHSGDPASPYQTEGVIIFEYLTRKIGQGTPFKVDDIQFMGDMDGNGLPDMVITDSYFERFELNNPQPYPTHLLLTSVNTSTQFDPVVFTSEGQDITSELESQISIGFNFFSTFADINGDGLADAVGWFTGIDSLEVMFNKGSGDFSAPKGMGRILESRSYKVFEPNDSAILEFFVPKYLDAFKFVDINQDGKSELLFPGQRLVEGCSVNYQPGGAIDICGDGIYKDYQNEIASQTTSLIDAARKDDSIYQFKAYYFDEAADGEFSAREVDTDIVGSATESAFVDAFGNGLMDFVFAYGPRFAESSVDKSAATDTAMAGKEFGYYINRNFGAGEGFHGRDYEPQDMIKSATNGLGVTSRWKYRPLSSDEYDSLTDGDYYHPTQGYIDQENRSTGEHMHFASSMYTVAAFNQDNGVGGYNQTRYRYAGAIYNTQGRGFQGFREIHVEDDTNKTLSVTQFHQIFPLTSRVEEQFVFVQKDADSPARQRVSHTTNNWVLNTAHQADFNSTGKNGLYSVYNQLSESKQYDLISGAEIASSRTAVGSIDKYGNVLGQTVETTDNSGKSQVHTSRVIDATASNYSFATWWLNKVTSQTTEYKKIDRALDTGDISNVIIGSRDRDRTITVTYNSYDNAHRKPTQVTTTVDDGIQRFYNASNKAVENVAGNNMIPVVVNTTFNDYGLPLVVQQQTQVYSGSSHSWVNRTRKTTYTYSKNGSSQAADGYFPYTVTQDMDAPRTDHALTTTVDSYTGQPLTVTDSNNVVTTHTYDGMGRLITAQQTGLPAQYIGYQGVAADADKPTHAAYRVVTRQAGAPEQIQYLDKLNRTLRTSLTAFDGTGKIFTDVTYDVRGLVSFESVPYLSGDARYGTTYIEYDFLGRLREKRKDQADGYLETKYVHAGFTTTITAGSLGAMSRTYNSKKQLVSTSDSLSNQTHYAYDNMGNPIVIRDANNNDIVADYNGLGHKLYVNDPNMGQTDFIVNGFGDVEFELDANKDTIDYEYDLLGRVKSRKTVHDNSEIPDSEAEYNWDIISGHGQCKIGLLCTESERGMSREYEYDSALRVTKTTTTLDATSYVMQQDYDSGYGRLKRLKYPNGLSVGYEYNSTGYLTREYNASSDYTYREITAQDAFGNITGAQMTNGIVEGSYYYAPQTGQMRQSYAQSNRIFHQLYYQQYDVYGNIKEVENLVTGTSESYVYDDLHRLTSNTPSYSGGTLAAVTYEYDNVGNFTHKSDYSTNGNSAYVYGNTARSNSENAGPNAVRSVTKPGGTATFTYDDKGNMLTGDGVTASYFASVKPHKLTRGSNTSEFFYGSDGARYKQVKGADTLYYINKFYEVEGNHWRAYIGDSAMIAQRANETDGTTETVIRFMHRDRLGSAVTMTDENGEVTERRRFDPFGKPRAVLGHDLQTPDLRQFGIDYTVINRGFTDHEHLDDQQLIHMNGRVYDYNVGRFMSVDPFIVDAKNSQAINPYSYVMNNPLGYTDPTGYRADEDVETVEVNKDAQVYEDANGNQYVDAGDGSGDVIQINSIEVTKSNGSTTNYSFSNGGKLSNVSTTDIGSPAQTATSSTSSGIPTNPLGKSVLGKAQDWIVDNFINPLPEIEEAASNIKEGDLSGAADSVVGIVAKKVKAVKNLTDKAEQLVEKLRQGFDVRVGSVEEARELLDKMPELKPGPGNLMPGLRDRRNTYRGDLINKEDPLSPQIHPAGKHKDQPHYNLDIRDENGVRQKPAIFIDD